MNSLNSLSKQIRNYKTDDFGAVRGVTILQEERLAIKLLG